MVGAPNRQRQNDSAKSAATKSSILTEENHQRRVTYSGREREEGAYRGKPPHQVRGGGAYRAGPPTSVQEETTSKGRGKGGGGLTGEDHHFESGGDL